MTDRNLQRLASLADLKASGPRVVRQDGKQIALFASGDHVLACNNRCPHEGYPLSEGSLSEDCILTCNWHNWKFNLLDGRTLVGGDNLRLYPVELDGDDVLVDLTDPPLDDIISRSLDGLLESFDRHEYDRMARELARIEKAGGDPLDAVRETVIRRYRHLEYGTTHAFAAAPDWLSLIRRRSSPADERLAALLEVIGHIARDSEKEPEYPFTSRSLPWNADDFISAIEAEDEPAAVMLLRGALTAGMEWSDLKPVFYQAALSHYQDFGHALIYAQKAGELIGYLGSALHEPLLLALTRSLVYATREDLIPQFSAYAPALDSWQTGDGKLADDRGFRNGSVPAILKAISGAAVPEDHLWQALFGAACWQMLHFDYARQSRTSGPVAQNVNWLDFTHAITFSHAVRDAGRLEPGNWPAGLLQIGCFLGRNSGHVDAEQDVSQWSVDDPLAFYDDRLAALLDHAQPEYIVSAHLVKLLTAARAETLASPDAPWVGDLAAASNRFLNQPIKRKHVLRTARQAIDFVGREG
ncbi:MAG: Rieske 2Fe-2S domain-containing protein [Rhodospirillales bacterium]